MAVAIEEPFYYIYYKNIMPSPSQDSTTMPWITYGSGVLSEINNDVPKIPRTTSCAK